jgi:hypothetical protein
MDSPPAGLFLLRFRSVFVVLVLSFFYMAFALSGKALFANPPRGLDIASFAMELVLGGIGGWLAYRFASNPRRYKIPIIVLLVAAAAFHGWLLLMHYDLRECQFGSFLCGALPYVYIGLLLSMAAVLAVAKQVRLES